MAWRVLSVIVPGVEYDVACLLLGLLEQAGAHRLQVAQFLLKALLADEITQPPPAANPIIRAMNTTSTKLPFHSILLIESSLL
jgi:hypothetical protein